MRLAYQSRGMASRFAPPCLVYVLALTPSLTAVDLAPRAEYEGKIVAHIRFDPPTQPLPSAELARLVGISEGATLHLADVRAAIKRLFGNR
jgi:outer membrane protein assembly factor BamA